MKRRKENQRIQIWHSKLDEASLYVAARKPFSFSGGFESARQKTSCGFLHMSMCTQFRNTRTFTLQCRHCKTLFGSDTLVPEWSTRPLWKFPIFFAFFGKYHKFCTVARLSGRWTTWLYIGGSDVERRSDEFLLDKSSSTTLIVSSSWIFEKIITNSMDALPRLTYRKSNSTTKIQPSVWEQITYVCWYYQLDI